MSINTRHALHPLALAVTLALTACGGNQDTPQTSAPGPQTKADTGLPATTLDTADTPAAAQTSASGRATKAVATADTPPLSENRKMLRGDVLIQALLSRTARLDAQNNPQTAWLSPETYTWGSLGAGQQGSEPSVVPVVLASQDIRPTDANTAALGRNYYQFEISQGPRRLINDPLMLNIASQTLRFGLSAAGLPNGGTGAAQAAAGALEIGTQAQAERTPSSADEDQYAPPTTTRETLVAKTVTTIQPNEVYDLDKWKHEWESSDPAASSQASVFAHPGDSANQFSTCAQFKPKYTEFETLCDVWEVPAGWKAGQPLKHVTQTFSRKLHSEMGGSYGERSWSNRKAPQYINAESLKTTTEAVNDRGVSGAVLVAMLDAFTPRAKGMQRLPAYATASLAPYKRPASSLDPQRVSFHHDSRATTYADGSADTATYSPATGGYLYVFSTGAWLSEQVPNTRSRDYPQNTLAIHVNANAQGLTLPRWSGLNVRGRNWELKATQVYEGEQLSGDREALTIAANKQIMFGIPVQSWYDEKNNPNAQVQLIIQQSQPNPRTVDMCWYVSVFLREFGRYCTTWTVPEGWTPGQPLLPQGYHAETDRPSENGVPTWSTQAKGQ